MLTNPIMVLAGVLQIGSGVYAYWSQGWKIALVNALVGVANIVLSTVVQK